MEDTRFKKLLTNLKNAFQRDPSIDEFDFLPILEPENNCNPIILENHKLGIEIWAGKLLFTYAYNELLNKCSRSNLKQSNVEHQIQLTRAVLLMNADNATAWNFRKSLMKEKFLPPKDDMIFSALVLTKHPKSPETFTHRKWVLNHLRHYGGSKETIETLSYGEGTSQQFSSSVRSEGNRHPHFLSEEMSEVVLRELDVCSHAAAKYPNNYNAWSHRIWLVKNICRCSEEVLDSELKYTSSWIVRNKSDYSGYHYRQFILDAKYSLTRAPLSSGVYDVLRKEINEIGENIRDFPGHETLWCHRRFCVQILLKNLSHREDTGISENQLDVSENLAVAPKKCKLELNHPHQRSDLSPKGLLQSERCFADSLIDCVGKQQFVPEWQRTLGTKYIKWLDMVSLQK